MDDDVAQRVRAAMSGVDRRTFLPPDQHRFAGADQALPIGHRATCSQPSTVRQMLTMLQVRPGHRVLDVGAGSGWTTAILAHLAAPGGQVLGVELEPELVAIGQANLSAWAEATEAGAPARIEPATPGELGLPRHGPFDRILVSAAARELPQLLVDQLVDGGRMVIPVQTRLMVAELVGGEVRTQTVGSYSFVPLRRP